MYSPDQWEILSEVNSVTCITILSLIFGRKLASIDGPVHYVRALLLIMYGLSWAFNLIACMLTSTNNGNNTSCLLTVFNCVLVYNGSKIALYLYFIEKIHIISVPKSSRLRSPLYLINFALLLPLIGIIILQIIFKTDTVSVTYPYHCTIGMEMTASVASLCYDILLTATYAGIFIKFYCFPNTAQQTAHQSTSLHTMAMRNIIAAVVSLCMSAINYVLLIFLQGNARGLIASSSMSLTTTVAAMVVHWVTTHPAEIQLSERALQRVGGDKPVRLEIKQHQEVVVLTELNRP